MYEGEKFLLKLYRELYAKDSVKHSGTISDDKYELISKYLKRLEGTEKIFASEHKELIKLLKKKYYDKYVIKREDIKNSMEDTKDKIIKSQQESLDNWLDYLMKEEKSYPMWARYWAFQGMLKLGKHDKDTNSFATRSKRTTYPFIELNKEALKQTMNLIITAVDNNKVDDITLEELIDNGNFGKIYAYNIKKQLEKQNRINTDEGIWKTYWNGEAKRLVEDIYAKNTGWCISSEAISNNYLDMGNMYIYYTKDELGDYTIPRICIRKENIYVVEVKGVLDDKGNLEASMIDIAIKELDKLKNGESFKQIGENLKKLAEIVEKVKKRKELSTEDLVFIYEINGPIKTYTIYDDPRIKQITNRRNTKEDLARIFNCKPKNICTKQEKLTKNNNYYVYYGDIHYENEEIEIPPVVIGNINLGDHKEVKGLENLELVTGSLRGAELLSSKNFQNLKQVTGSLELIRLKDSKGLENLEKVGRTLNIYSLEDLTGLRSLKETGNLNVHSAVSSKGLENLSIVRGNLDIANMIDLSGFESLRLIENDVICYASNSLKGLPNLKVKGNEHFYHLINIHNLFGKSRTRKR